MKKICLMIALAMLVGMVVGCSPSPLELQGIVETDLYSHYCEVSGKIISFPVQLGQEVKKGDIIAIIDDSNEKYLLEQLQAGLVKKQATLADLETAVDALEIKQGQNNLQLAEQAYESARLNLEQAQQKYGNLQALFKAGAVSQSSRDDAKYQLDQARIALSSAALQVDNARQKLAMLEKGPDQEKIAAARADIEQTQSQIRQAEANLAKYKVTAISDGIIVSKHFLEGDIVSAGSNLAEIASQQDKYLVTYVPEDYINNISYGQELAIYSGKTEYKGTVSFIDLKAQYTPKDMQTQANKNKNSVKIRLKLAADNPLKPGEKATVFVSR